MHNVYQILDGAFDLAEPHFLASGKRDSARLLAQMLAEWHAASGGSPGAFALRGTLPYLQNGNILAARTFIKHFVAQLPRLRPATQPDPIPVGTSAGASEIVLTTEPVLNFAQLAVLTCQRAQGDRNKTMREAWVRLCGTYQSKGGLLAEREVRVVGRSSINFSTE